MKRSSNRKVFVVQSHIPDMITKQRCLPFSASASSEGIAGYSTSQKSLEAMVQAAVEKVLSSGELKGSDISGDRYVAIISYPRSKIMYLLLV